MHQIHNYVILLQSCVVQSTALCQCSSLCMDLQGGHSPSLHTYDVCDPAIVQTSQGAWSKPTEEPYLPDPGSQTLASRLYYFHMLLNQKNTS